MSELSDGIKKHTLKSRETIPLIVKGTGTAFLENLIVRTVPKK
jgi:hypothetical protein